MKTRLQSLNKGSNEETYNGVVDCVRSVFCSLVPTSSCLSLPSCCVNNRFLRLAAKSCGRRDPRPSWRVRAAGPSSSLPCSASRRSCTLSASANTSWTTRRSASCQRELTSRFQPAMHCGFPRQRNHWQLHTSSLQDLATCALKCLKFVKNFIFSVRRQRCCTNVIFIRWTNGLHSKLLALTDWWSGSSVSVPSKQSCYLSLCEGGELTPFKIQIYSFFLFFPMHHCLFFL